MTLQELMRTAVLDHMREPVEPERRSRPRRSILDPEFKYTPAASTNVAETWKRFGFKNGGDDVDPKG